MRNKILMKEINNDFHLLENVTMFRHFDKKTQDRFIKTLDKLPNLKFFLLKVQKGDEVSISLLYKSLREVLDESHNSKSDEGKQ